MEWNQTYANNYDNSSYFVSSTQTWDGGYIAVGIFGRGLGYSTQPQPLLILTDQFGNVQSKMTRNSAHWNRGYASSVIVTNEDAYVVTGEVDKAVWLAKFSSKPASLQTEQLITMVAIIVAVIGVGAGLQLYLKKRKRGH